MVFSESVFMFLFLPIVLSVYYAVPFKFKNIVLFISGLLFYAWGEPLYVYVMFLSTLIDYSAGRIMNKFDDKEPVRRVALIVSVVMNLSLLGVFKYSGFFVETVNSIFGSNIADPNLPLPIGISFFTFQSMSYTIDLYRRKIDVQKSFIKFGAFVTMFPQIVAGPIVRYEDVASELEERKIDFEAVSNGISRFICGLCKKVLVANSIGELWSQVKTMEYSSMPALTAWLGIAAFTLQIYFDFSGYSDMAIGLGKMLGFNFPENFDHPYNSESVSEFWRRWHMTLGGWFKSYVYIPLGGNRKGIARTILNTFVVWFLTGMWHGASLNFILWGIYYGLLIILEKFVFKNVIEKIPVFIKRIYTLFVVVIGWVIFEIALPSDEISFVGAMFGASGKFADKLTVNLLHDNIMIFVIAAVVSTGLPLKLYGKFFKTTDTADSRGTIAKAKTSEAIEIVAQLVGLIICIAFLVDSGYNPFLYFNF